jgi:NADPH-dependent 2,4-dienoyl-CoA reductase/sulfur reductase-like enzyme
MEGWMVGKRILILGSGDIGLIMARRMTLEGAEVLACVELLPYSNGLTRNIVQCLEDYDIPLLLSHTITGIIGEQRVERAIVSRVDADRKPVPGTEIVFDCDTILLSVGLIPENELARNAGIPIDPRTGGAFVYDNMETSYPGIFACGNAVHVHDLADFVTEESRRAGAAAAMHAKLGLQAAGAGIKTGIGFPASGAGIETGSGSRGKGAINIEAGRSVAYTVPQLLRRGQKEKPLEIFFRVTEMRRDSAIVVADGDKEIARFTRERMAPGEMERILIPSALLDRVQGSKITIEIEDVRNRG